ncbi:MAG: hydrogenobyrinic acid a,c-diamide synthase (glutamine-hydrolyzing) [Bacteroidetes bacterium]|nr:hydrogenobyrinic acid a,c-diamide synthase (glutamine-hydrolyzing) [Bacteroidota bacterium]
MLHPLPSIIIAGTGGDSGKTFVSCGIIAELKRIGLKQSIFKKGPDYIDPAWLMLSSGNVVRNLDTYLMGNENVIKSFLIHSKSSDISVIEGNRGLYDGFDTSGTHSTAELAKLLKVPVILVLNVTKMTRTASAIVLGCKTLDKDIAIRAVILNQVGGKRHEKIIRDSIENDTGIPVIGAIPRLKNADILPSRHLGLITPREYSSAYESIEMIRKVVSEHVDIDKLIEIAKSAQSINFELPSEKIKSDGKGLRLGYFNDKVFSFYYPENLEALKMRGAELIGISSIQDSRLPEIDGLYIGGGFPESNVEELVNNHSLMKDVKEKAEKGIPIYAECGGLIYLAESIEFNGTNYPMAGVFPIKIKMEKEPQGHGYMIVNVDSQNPFFDIGTEIKGHEFHYSHVFTQLPTLNTQHPTLNTQHPTLNTQHPNMQTCLTVHRGKGTIDGRDGLIYKNVFASYLHIHSLGCPQWVDGIIRVMKNNK